MRSDEAKPIEDLLERQARWQKARRDLSWPVKIRMAEEVRESILKLRAAKPRCSTDGIDTRPARR